MVQPSLSSRLAGFLIQSFFGVLVTLVALGGSSSVSQAKEVLGHLSLDEVYLRSEFFLQEPQQGEFRLDQSFVSFLWEIKPHLATRIKVGSLDLIKRPIHFVSENEEGWGVIEAYGQWQGVYGRLRMGLLPLNYGVEGAMSESELLFPRSLLFQKRVVGLRDLGLSYFISHNGFYTEAIVHNGEGGDNRDGRVWHTATWGWKDRDKFKVGLSGQTGTTKPISTENSGDTWAGVDPTKEAKWRMGTFFVQWYPSEWKTILELTWGEREQDSEEEKFGAGHFDLIYDFNSSLSGLLRYDQIDPSEKVKGDLLRHASAGLVFRGHHSTSSLILLYTKALEEDKERPNDQYRLVWRLSPWLPQNVH